MNKTYCKDQMEILELKTLRIEARNSVARINRVCPVEETIRRLEDRSEGNITINMRNKIILNKGIKKRLKN